GFERVVWPCRMEVLSRSPLLVADGAHNVYSVEILLDSLPKYLEYDRLIVVAGFSRDKDVQGMARALENKADVIYATSSRHPRSLTPTEVSGLFANSGKKVLKARTPADALKLALNTSENKDLVLATGSLFLTAEVRESFLGLEPEMYPELPTPGSPV
ncbi:MAG: cyanophycin synthetase, partial [Chloroflexota bacterium]|nr:cyanophycin synthetase [Chloroflexota bacterium]